MAAARLWATLVEAAGGGACRRRWRPASSSRPPAPVLSELYLTNGVNRFSLVDGDDQLLWESRFAPPEPDVLPGAAGDDEPGQRARRPAPSSPVPPEAILGRLRAAFAGAPPLSGTAAAPAGAGALGGGRGQPAARGPAADGRAGPDAWPGPGAAFVPAERPPGEEAREWYTAESP